MSSVTTGPWPDAITRSFSIAGKSSTAPPPDINNPFFGSWNRLLNAMFPPDSIYQVVPQCFPPISIQLLGECVGEAFYLAIYVNTSLVFFVQVKPPAEFPYVPWRRESDNQMRQRFLDAGDGMSIPVLYGISAYGPKISIYKYDKDTNNLQPKKNTVPDPLGLPDPAPQDQWCWDIFEEEGAAKFQQIIEEVKIMSREAQFIA